MDMTQFANKEITVQLVNDNDVNFYRGTLASEIDTKGSGLWCLMRHTQNKEDVWFNPEYVVTVGFWG